VRILHTIDYPWWNGSAYYGITVALAMAMKDHNVLVVGREGSPPIEKARELGLKVSTGLDLRGKSQWKGGRGLFALRKVIKGFKPRVVVSHDGDSHTLSCLAMIYSGERPLLIRGRGDIRTPSKHILSWWLYGRRTDAFLLSGDFMIRRGDFKGVVKRDSLHVIHPSIDVTSTTYRRDRERLRDELHVSNESPLAGLVARYDPVKGHDTFLKVAWRLKRLFPEARYLAAGVEEGVKIDHLGRMSREMGLSDRFFFLGRRSSSDEIISSLDVGVIASRGSEAVCRILLEYMLAGVPVVATSVGVIPEVVEDGVTGFLVPPDDYEEMARKVGALFRDRGLREKMGRKGRNRVEEHFSLERMSSELEDLISRLVGVRGEESW